MYPSQQSHPAPHGCESRVPLSRENLRSPLGFDSVLKPQYTIAAYARISKQDDAKDESVSIANQRAMIHNYISSLPEFAGAKVVDYIDDGISGSHTDREAYQRLMADIKRGAVQCIATKDLSRIGRNLIDVDDLLMNHLVTQGVRFIAINNNYDSLKHPLSNLELAVINLANQHYNRDLAQKSMTSKLVKMKRGESLCAWAPFGYRKSETERNKLVIDEESAETVRMIFSLALGGNNTTKIAKILNAQGIPTPREQKVKQGIDIGRKSTDPGFHFWTDSSVRRTLHDLRYTGAAVGNMNKVTVAGSGKIAKRPKDEWVIVPGAHEAIISKAEYDKAHEAIRRGKLSDVPLDHIFYSKVKCTACGRTMKRSNPRNPVFKCITHKFTDHYDCHVFSISQADIEKSALESIKAYAAVLIDREALKLDAIQQSGISKAEIEGRIKAELRAIRMLEESVTKNIAALVSGKITQDVFLGKKKIINDTTAQKNAELERLREQLEAICAGKDAIEEKLSELNPLLTIEKLDREIVDLLIDKVVVHGEKQIEIVWSNRF